MRKILQIELNTKDETLAKKISQVVNDEISNPDFNINKFCDLMQKSRTQLYRTLKKTTGKSPAEFIKHQRIKMAHKLLAEENINVREVSKLVGFKDSSYFAKVFKSVMNASPGSFKKLRIESKGREL